MENNEVFTYHYSATQSKEVESIRRKYLPREETKFERLQRLDNRVQAAGVVPSLVMGVIGCLIFGIGMCFGLDVFVGADFITVLFCVMGALIMLPAYPVYKYVAQKTKSALAPEILRLSDEIIGE